MRRGGSARGVFLFMYDCIIVGGGIAGLQASIQLGRYRRKTLVIDRGDGRSAMCRRYRNVLGYPDGVSGEELRELGRRQAAVYGVEFLRGDVTEAGRMPGGFLVRCETENSLPTAYEGKTLLLATGVKDRFPPLPGLRPCLGLSVFICPDCDGIETSGKRTIVLGSGDAGASMAAALTYFCNDLVYVNHDGKPVSEGLDRMLREHRVDRCVGPIERVLVEGDEAEGRFKGVRLANGVELAGDCGFIAFGGNDVRTDLAKQLGVERMENQHIVTDPRTKMTSVPGVWAAGDVGVHSEQLTIAMGEGQQAAIWMHKWLLKQEKEGSAPVPASAHSLAAAGKP